MPHPNLNNIRRVARGEAPIPMPPRASAAYAVPPLPDNFWWLWLAGTVVTPTVGLGGLGIASAGGAFLGGLLLLAGLGALVGNIWFAITTDGYVRGNHLDFARGLALVTGWIGAVPVLVLVASVVLGFVLFLAMLQVIMDS